jgi:hypothetical protein
VDATVDRGVSIGAAVGYTLSEYACHEGNYGLANILSAARAAENAGR